MTTRTITLKVDQEKMFDVIQRNGSLVLANTLISVLLYRTPFDNADALSLYGIEIVE